MEPHKEHFHKPAAHFPSISCSFSHTHLISQRIKEVIFYFFDNFPSFAASSFFFFSSFIFWLVKVLLYRLRTYLLESSVLLLMVQASSFSQFEVLFHHLKYITDFFCFNQWVCVVKQNFTHFFVVFLRTSTHIFWCI